MTFHKISLVDFFSPQKVEKRKSKNKFEKPLNGVNEKMFLQRCCSNLIFLKNEA